MSTNKNPNNNDQSNIIRHTNILLNVASVLDNLNNGKLPPDNITVIKSEHLLQVKSEKWQYIHLGNGKFIIDEP